MNAEVFDSWSFLVHEANLKVGYGWRALIAVLGHSCVDSPMVVFKEQCWSTIYHKTCGSILIQKGGLHFEVSRDMFEGFARL